MTLHRKNLIIKTKTSNAWTKFPNLYSQIVYLEFHFDVGFWTNDVSTPHTGLFQVVQKVVAQITTKNNNCNIDYQSPI